MLVLFLSNASIADNSAILHIRKEYQSILNTVPSLKAESLPLSEYSTEGGEAKAYRDSSGNIRLLRIQVLFESGTVFEEFYYENGMLIFAFYQSHRYNVPFYVMPQTAKEIGSEPFDPKKTIIIENRYYFDRGKMIRWLNESKNEVKPNSKIFREAEKEVAETSSEMLSKFKRNP